MSQPAELYWTKSDFAYTTLRARSCAARSTRSPRRWPPSAGPRQTSRRSAVERGHDERARKAHEHARLVECVIAGDAEGAAAVMHEHISTSLGGKAATRLGVTPASTPRALR